MEIRVVIVDDAEIFAENIKRTVESYIPMHGVTYNVQKCFMGLNAFDEAKKYIIKNQSKIDLLLIDYSFPQNFGIELFTLLDNSLSIYRILHSQTHTTFFKTQKKYQLDYDFFCKSKEEPYIKNALKDFEEDILKNKIYGVMPHRLHFYTTNLILKKDTAKESPVSTEGVNYRTIRYIKSIKKGSYQIFYLQEETNILTFVIANKTTLKEICGDNPCYLKVSSTIAVNMLWVAKFDPWHHKIHFIPHSNVRLSIDYVPLTKETLSRYRSTININVPKFFHQ